MAGRPNVSGKHLFPDCGAGPPRDLRGGPAGVSRAGVFPNQPEQSAGVLFPTRRAELRRGLSAATERPENESAAAIHRGFFPGRRIRRRGFGTIQSQRAANPVPTRRARRAAARVFRADARRATLDATVPAAPPPRRGFSFPGKRTRPRGFLFPRLDAVGFSSLDGTGRVGATADTMLCG